MKNSILKFFILNSTFLILLSTACSRKKEVPVDLGPAPAISDFVLKNLASEFPGEIKTADYAGKVQLVLFFRSDDPACRGSIADWNGLQKDFADRGFALIGVVVDDRPVAQIAAEVVALHADFPVGLASDTRLVEAFGGPAASAPSPPPSSSAATAPSPAPTPASNPSPPSATTSPASSTASPSPPKR